MTRYGMLLALTVGCALSPSPSPRSIDPSIVPAGVETPALITGDHFFNQIHGSLTSEASSIERDWSVEVGAIEASGVVRVDSQTIELVVPDTLDPGEYSVTLVAPSGERLMLPQTLWVEPAVPRVVIESAGDGSGVPIGAMSLGLGDVLDVFAVVREGGAFVAPASVDWRVDGGVGSVPLGPSTSTRFTAEMPGQGRLVASHARGEAQSGLLTVEGLPGDLFASLTVPATGEVAVSFLVALEVSNLSGEDMADVRPCALDAPGAAVGALEVAPVSLAAGERTTFRWELKALARGTLELSTCATGVVVGSEISSSNTVAASIPIGLTTDPSVTEVLFDPFGDGATHSFVNGYHGGLLLGPSADGTSLLHLNADRSTSVFRMSFPRDRILSMSRNTSAEPFPSVGFTGCEPNTPECGPDNEDGRGLMRTVTLGGAEWIVIGGARSGGELKYVYLSSGDGPNLDFYYISLDLLTGPQTQALSAVHAFDDRLFLGFVDTGARRPHLLSLGETPRSPGLDVITQGVNHRSDQLAGIAPGATSMIDLIWVHAGRPYVANAGRWYRSGTPRPLADASVWVDVSPSHPAYLARESVPSSLTADLNPSDRAVPQVAILGDRLYVARNTSAGPQLFVCDAGSSGDAGQCDAGDWTLVAANTAGDLDLTQFDDRTHVSISLLVATDDALFVGFDSASGVEVFRSATSDPRSVEDFVGNLGCTAGEASCVGLGGRGLGRSANSRVFDARGLDLGDGPAVYLTAGGGSGVGLYRID